MSIAKLFVAILPFLVLHPGQQSYEAGIENWRKKREATLRSDDGWLTMAGLYWLKEGKNSVGTDPANSFVLPEGSAPGMAGAFEFHHGDTIFEAAPGVDVSLNGKRAVSARLKPDSSGSPDLLRIRGLTMFVIQRGSRFGVRLKDKNSPRLKSFAGLRFFPVRAEYRIRAKFVPYNPPKMIKVPNILGDASQEASPGYVEFTLGGRTCRLDPLQEGDMLFFIFRDKTSGKETYPSGRFLYTDLPKNGEVVLDFNKAVNPPCAFTPFATCPLPPKQNALGISIAAGEMRYGH